jgi:ectoine hydroxylase-related dioxygenase (phytanoyl-CoA dioxygenase family)
MTAQEIATKIKDSGYAVINNVLSLEDCERFKSYLNEDSAKYMPMHANPKTTGKPSLNNLAAEKVLFNLHNKRLEYYELMCHPLITSVMDIILKEGSYLNNEPYYLYNNSARNPMKGSEQQLHIDSRFPGTKYVFVANVLWMIEDFTEESGATRIVPDSHKSGLYAEDGKKYENEILVIAPKGSVLIFDASLWHGSSYKHNEDSRWALTLGYARWFRKPAYDFMQNIPADIFNKLNDKQKELLGLKLIPPKDEFTRTRAMSENFETPFPYQLPK